MAEYIDKQVLLERLQRKKAGPANIKYTDGFNDAIMRVRSMVSKAQPVDVAPVVHGQWSRHGFSEDCDLRDTCSVCGHSFYEHLKVSRIPRYHYYCCSWKYCPNCGAKMDLE